MRVVSRENAQVRARDMRFVGSRLSLVGDLKFDPPYQFQSSQGICDSFCLTVVLNARIEFEQTGSQHGRGRFNFADQLTLIRF